MTDLAPTADATRSCPRCGEQNSVLADVCEKCGENIPKERLKALPYAALCVKCKSGGLSRR